MWFILVLFLMLGFSQAVWKIVPFMNYFQFPWRLLSLEILFASFLAGSISSLKINKRVKIFFAICLIFLVFILGVGYTKPAYYMHREDSYYFTRSNFMDGTNSPGNVFNTVWFNTALKKQKNKILFKNNDGQVKSQFLSPTRYLFDVVIQKTTEVTINTAYFPGWEVFVSGEKAKIFPNEDGLISISISEGKHSILVVFRDNYIRKIAKLITFASLLWLIGR